MKLNKINETKFSLTNANNIEAFLHNFHITLFILFFFNYDLSTNLNFNVTKCFIIIQYKNSTVKSWRWNLWLRHIWVPLYIGENYTINLFTTFNRDVVLEFREITKTRVLFQINNLFNPVTCLCLSKARTWISNIPFSFCVQWVQLRWEMILRFVDIGGIDDHHCLNFLFITELQNLKWKQICKIIWNININLCKTGICYLNNICVWCQ